MCMCAQSHPTLSNPMNCSPTGSSVRGISQAWILEWIAISISRRSFHPGIEPLSPALAGGFFTFATNTTWVLSEHRRKVSSFPRQAAFSTALLVVFSALLASFSFSSIFTLLGLPSLQKFTCLLLWVSQLLFQLQCLISWSRLDSSVHLTHTGLPYTTWRHARQGSLMGREKALGQRYDLVHCLKSVAFFIQRLKKMLKFPSQ